MFQENNNQGMNSPRSNLNHQLSYISPYPQKLESNHKPPISTGAKSKQLTTHKRVGQAKNSAIIDQNDVRKITNSSHRQSKPKSIKRNNKSSMDSYKQIK